MEFEKTIYPFLEGKKFENGFYLKIGSTEQKLFGRIEFLENLVKGKSVIHVGCCNHLPLIDQMIKEKRWAHSRLCDITKRCFGVDIAEDSVNYLRDKLGFKDLVSADITKDNIPELNKNNWDYMLIPEVLEHIDNPVSFLNSIREKYQNNVQKLVISVPNAFAFENINLAYSNTECINSDHRYWFSPYTLAKVITQAGFKVDSYFMVDDFKGTSGLKAKIKILPFFQRKKKYYLLKKNPALRETIIMVVNF
jgi:2-polyprenyl-3-methyl-5-hydroxy-6-metoxy-1,4-benzoquinol methylase